jgi:hypothetical protein
MGEEKDAFLRNFGFQLCRVLLEPTQVLLEPDR